MAHRTTEAQRFTENPSKSGETWASFKPRGLEVEQLPPLCVSGDWDRRDRIRVDSARPGTEGARRSASDFPSPRLAPKTGARTWGTRQEPRKDGAASVKIRAAN